MDVEVLDAIFLVYERYFLITNCILISKLCCIYKKYSYSLFKQIPEFPSSFFNCYLAVPWPTLGHSQGHSLTNLMLITAFVHIQPEGHWEPRNEVGSLSPAKHLAGFEPGTFQFLLQHLNPLSHSFLDRGS